MKLHSLPKINKRPKKRVGRGIGSGKGKTSGRGSKGQKARGKVSWDFTGGGLPLYKKIPYLRGSKNRKVSPKPMIITLNDLNKFRAKTLVNEESLINSGLVSQTEVNKYGVKVLGQGELKVAITLDLPYSKKAKEAVEKAGGKIA